DDSRRADLLCELNVLQQVTNVCDTTIVQSAWQQGQKLSVNGWIYRVKDGLLHDLGHRITCDQQLTALYRQADAPQA
ncbi:MAG: carbonic anhydrase, partial [Gammaproteobacteria bacterium]|nr:carbonic anhydrase [Gammaproteobacteria bacterium]